jgi:hypothetical protein
VYQDNSLLQTGTWKCCTGNIISQAYNIDTGVYRVWIDGSLVATNTWSTRPTDEDLFIFGSLESKTSNEFRVNYGQRPFLLATELGFGDTNKLLSNNLPEPTIKNGKEYFDSVLYSGTGSAQSITGLEFQPDFVWIKKRDNEIESHRLTDVVRGTTKTLLSDFSGPEVTSSDRLTAFNSDGFSVGTDVSVNQSGRNYVAWCWKAGGTAVSNTDGTITSSVSANTDAGFSIVSYTGTTTNGATIGHGLNSAPELIIVKDRDFTRQWAVYHESVGNSSALFLNETDQQANTSALFWNSTSPTDSVFTVGTSTTTNDIDDYIAYCWHSVEAFSKIGSYVGNNSTDGPFVYTGMAPSWVMVKSTSVSNWTILDSTRDANNPADKRLFANTNGQETENGDGRTDFLSNGFKLRHAGGAANNDGETYVYLALAKNPFGGENAPPATAR